MDQMDVLRTRVERLIEAGDQAVMDFLAVVFTCEGKLVSRDYAFNGFKQRWGDEDFARVQAMLTAPQSILTDDAEGLRVSHPEPERAARELGDLLYSDRRAHYRSILRRMASTPGGRVFLGELARVGPDIRDSDLERIGTSMRAGYEQVRENLSTNGILITYLYSNTQGFHRVLPQSIPEMVRLVQAKPE